MNEQDAVIHRTWVQFLLDSEYKEAAAIALDSELVISKKESAVVREDGLGTEWEIRVTAELYVPTAFYIHVKNNNQLQKTFEETIRMILHGRTLSFEETYDNGWKEINNCKVDLLSFVIHIKLLPIEEGWQDTIRALITSSKGVRNQGATTELMFAREKKDPILYNGLKFASQSEVRIAQELMQRKVLFFPLAVGVRAETGQQYKDHCEVDFLICVNGIWGILEVSGPSHNGRLAQDTEKDRWLKKSGILCIEHRTAEQCYANPKQVTDEFLATLAQYKK